MLRERMEEIRGELCAFDDPFMRYSFLVELSAYVDANQPGLMVDGNLQRGCQSRVCVSMRAMDGPFDLDAASDTPTIRGVLYVMSALYNGVTLEEIASTDIDFLEQAGIAEHFSDTRATGIRSIADSIVTFCRERRGRA